MAYKIKLEQFEGPLDLLLQLIEKDDLDISRISLAKIADEYISYVKETKDIPLEELADFILVASKMLYIKSKNLLPYLVFEDEEEEADLLEEQLKLYKEFINASERVLSMVKNRKFLFSRERITVEKGFYPPQKFKATDLKNAYMAIIGRLEPLIKKSREAREKIISIKQKIEDLSTIISRRAQVGFKEFVGKAKDKTEVVVSFLALLELIKQKIINVSQKDLFEDIMISKTKKGVKV